MKIDRIKVLSTLLDVFVSNMGTDYSFQDTNGSQIMQTLEKTFLQVKWTGEKLRCFWDKQIIGKLNRANTSWEAILLLTFIKMESAEMSTERDFFIARISHVLSSIQLEFPKEEILVHPVALKATLQKPFLPVGVFTYNFLQLPDVEQKYLLPLVCDTFRRGENAYIETINLYKDEADLEGLIILEQNLPQQIYEELGIDKILSKMLPLRQISYFCKTIIGSNATAMFL